MCGNEKIGTFAKEKVFDSRTTKDLHRDEKCLFTSSVA